MKRAAERSASGRAVRSVFDPVADPRPRLGTIGLRGRCMEFQYDLATGRWQSQGESRGIGWRLESSACVELVDQLGQYTRRDVANSALVTCDEELPEGSGRRIQVWRVWPDGLAVCQRFAIHPDQPNLVAELSIRAPRQYRLALRSLSPLACPDSTAPNLTLSSRDNEGRSRMSAPAPSEWRVLDLGWSAAEPAVVLPVEPGAEVIATGLAALGPSDAPFRLTMGFLDAGAVVGRYRLDALDARRLGLDGEADFGTIDLGTGEVTGGPLWIWIGPVEDALPRFAVAWRERHPPNGQLPSFVQWVVKDSDTFETSEAGTLDRLGTLAARTGSAALDVVTIGAGWQHSQGDWTEDLNRFPHGLQALRSAIDAQGFRSGVTVSPFLVARSSELFRQHPTWVVRSPTGDPIAVCPDLPDTFGLDLSQPSVVEWLRTIGRRIADDWTFDLVLIDCLDQSVVSGWREDGFVSPLQAFRSGLRAIKEPLSNRPLVASGGPLFASLGIADALLTDHRPLWRADPSASLRAFLRRTGMLTGSGPVRLDWPGQTLDEARAAATIASFAGGAITLAGDLRALSPERAEVLRASLPPYDACSIVPIDPIGVDGPCLFACQVKLDWDDYFLLVVLNPRDRPVARVISLASLGLAPGRYHAFEFWSQHYLGILTKRIVLELIPSGGCAVVAIRPALEVPRIVGTSLHVSMGAIALQGASFDRQNRRLHLAIGAAGERHGTLTVALPRTWTPGPIRGTGGAMSVHQTTDQLAEIDVTFTDVAELELEFWVNRNE